MSPPHGDTYLGVFVGLNLRYMNWNNLSMVDEESSETMSKTHDFLVSQLYHMVTRSGS